jgi:hypothetical protein
MIAVDADKVVGEKRRRGTVVVVMECHFKRCLASSAEGHDAMSCVRGSEDDCTFPVGIGGGVGCSEVHGEIPCQVWDAQDPRHRDEHRDRGKAPDLDRNMEGCAATAVLGESQAFVEGEQLLEHLKLPERRGHMEGGFAVVIGMQET